MKQAQAKTTAAALALVLTWAGQASMAGTVHYRWLDERGTPVHSDRPPPKGVPYEVISTGSTLKRVVTADEGAVPPETSPRVGNEFKRVDAREQVAPKDPELCKSAKANLETLDTFARIRVPDGKGDYRYIDEEEKAAQRDEAKALIAANCD